MSLGLNSSALLVMRKWRCCRKACVSEHSINRTMPEWCRCFRSRGHSKIGPFLTKHSNAQKISMTLSFWLSQICQRSKEARQTSGFVSFAKENGRATPLMLKNSLVTKRWYSATSIVHAIACIESSTLRDSGDGTAVFTVWGKEEQRKLGPSQFVHTSNPRNSSVDHCY